MNNKHKTMRSRYLVGLVLFFTTFILASCIQDEAPNAECDIVSIDTTFTWFRENREALTGDYKIKNKEITFIVKKDVDFNSIEIAHNDVIGSFTLTEGAEIEPKGDVTKNNNGITLFFTTSSEDGNWHKDYKLSFIKIPPLEKEHVFSFEHFITAKYTTWFEVNSDGINSNIWANGNPGFSSSGMGKTPEDYPTTTDESGFDGKCIRLTTRDTGLFGKAVGMPIAAGNIFIGEFDNKIAMMQPLMATRMGLQIMPKDARPVSLTGYYKYTPGEIFTDKKKNPVEGRRDACAIYSVVYEVDPDNFVPLNGGDVTTSDRIVLIAQMENPGEPTEWTEFNIEYKPMNDKVFDSGKIEKNEYAIAVVASSSKDGAFFEGAVGSTLLVDEMRINWENR